MGSHFAEFGDDVSWYGQEAVVWTIIKYVLHHPNGKVFVEKWPEWLWSMWDSVGGCEFQNLTDDELQLFDEILDDFEQNKAEATKHWHPDARPMLERDFVAFREKLRERWWGFRL